MDLLERQNQLEDLARCAREASTGAGRLIFVSGEAGAGKSVLLEQFTAAAPRGFSSYWGHCDALETSRVLGAVFDIFVAMGRSHAALPTMPAREQLFTLLLERLSPPNPPSIVVLEDLHWADEATLDFVRFLGRRIQRARCLLICTYRDDEITATHPLRRVLGGCPTEHTLRLHLPPLSLAAVKQIGRAAKHDLARVYEITGGNPFFVKELLAAPPGAVPETVRDAILTRLAQCGPKARELAEIVSLIPGRVETWLARALLGESAEAADEAVARGLLRHQDGTLSYRHELGRLAVEGSVPPGRAQRLHRSILTAITAHDADLSRRVHHALHADDAEAVLDCAPRAARQASAAGAHREAASHLAKALRYASRLEPLARAELLEAHARESATINATEVAIDSASQALDLWRIHGQVEAQARTQRLLASSYWKAGDKLLADRFGDQAIALLEALPPNRELARALSSRSQRAMASGHADEALSYGQRAIDLAIRFDDAETRSHALNNIGSALLLAGDDSGTHHLEQALAIALKHGLTEHAGRAYANLVTVAVRRRMPMLGRSYFRQGVEYCDQHEVQDSLAFVCAWGAQLELCCGNWAEAARIAAEVIDCHQPSVAQRIPALLALGLVRARRGDPGAEASLEEAARLATPTGELQRIGPVAAALAEIAWYRGDLSRVSMEAVRGLDAAAGHHEPWIRGELAFWASLGEAPLDVEGEIAQPFAHMIAGEWQAAAALWQRLEAPYERALCLAHGPQDELLEALTILERMGNGPLTAIVRQRLRALGARGIPRGRRASTRRNPAGLTTREIQVLSLLVHGHTNAELAQRMHVAPKTVEHHVSSILGKLAVDSRTEAVAAAFGLGIVKPEPRVRR